ncbi:MAG TPA: hypothetical protein VM509_03715, partial [Planctomycetota bacterium]|nr:hypothetical protein [Planctomycetota bacterium]
MRKRGWFRREALHVGLILASLVSVAPALGRQVPEAGKVETRIRAAYQEEERRLDGSVTQIWTNTTS